MPSTKGIQKMRPLKGKLMHIPVNHKERQAARYKGICHIEGPGFARKLALTFDDGPSGLTEPLLDLLTEAGVKATFFWLGKNLRLFPDVARRALSEGHTFGNHSFDHPDFTKISAAEVLVSQIGKAQQTFRDVLGIEPSLVRPPFGDITDGLVDSLKDMGIKIVYWSIDAGDWITGNNSAAAIVSRVVSILHEEAIVLMHDGGSANRDTITAVRSIIDTCRTQGYEFVTVHDLLGVEACL